MRYATRATIQRLVEAARDAGIDVGAIEFRPDGSVQVIDIRAITLTREPQSDFDRLKHLL